MRPTPLIAAIALSTAAMAAHATMVIQSPFLLANGDFESSNVAANSYKYINYVTTTPVSATGWDFAGASGIANHSSAWGGVATTSSVAFLQSYPGLDVATLSQTFYSPYGGLAIAFTAAQRPGSNESLDVLLDGVDLTPTLLTPAGTDWTSYALSAGPLQAGPHTLTFVGVKNNVSDSSLFLDSIVVTSDGTVPEPGSLLLSGGALVGLAWVRRQRRRTAR